MTERSRVEKTDAIYPCEEHQFITQDPRPEQDLNLNRTGSCVSPKRESRPSQ